MAVELCSDNSGMSPRISFSLDLCHFDEVPVDQRPLRSSKPSSLNSSIDFDFCVGESLGQQLPSSSADELFSGGKILPTDIKKNNIPSKQTDHQSPLPPFPPPPHDDVDITSTKESRKEDYQKQSSSKSSSFWGFKRSRSFTCGSGYGRSLCSLPLLSRSNSTGSKPNPKHPSNNPKQINPHKSTSTNYQKPPLKKTSGAHKPYGVHVNPVVLNVPSANLFGLSSIFFNGKAKKHHCKRK
ncbi:hypothetical protein F3Y22_tig00111105pilonHSYRG00225 [Hibiscus syriacus]|uniref:Uncharacterized protein n=1 Tax=Hibiscus syriacus TaxID=106335 RepID=A0A6A2YYL3_HIBSY|nr:uncharacterized protein LOC120154186 [Hibiscus syriacus]KAE8684691.1 hypothetical protein F3Y22_tig00111105pilonHSYRG00225 [Hibiscus syriacus]